MYFFDGENILFDASLVIYTGCHGRNVPDFGRMFLKLKYTDLTKKPISEFERLRRKWQEKSVIFLRFHVLYLVRVTYYPYTAHVRRSIYSPLKCIYAVTAHVKCLET